MFVSIILDPLVTGAVSGDVPHTLTTLKELLYRPFISTRLALSNN